jgi:hypothetical protein
MAHCRSLGCPRDDKKGRVVAGKGRLLDEGQLLNRGILQIKFGQLFSRPCGTLSEWGENFKVYAPFESILNDMVYEKYHLFRPTARMLPGYKPAPKDK